MSEQRNGSLHRESNFSRLSCALCVVVVLFWVAPVGAEDNSPFIGQTTRNSLIIPGELVVTFKRGVNVKRLMSLFSDAAIKRPSMTAVKPKRIGSRTIVFSLIKPFAIQADTRLRDPIQTTMIAKLAFEKRDDVESVEPVYIAYPFKSPNDPFYPEMWNYHTRGSGPMKAPGGANFPDAWEFVTGDAKIKVAVIDTGILLNEPEFKNSANILSGVDLISDAWMANDGDPGNAGDSTDYDDDPTDPGDAAQPFECGTWQWYKMNDSWHGSHVSGTAGAGTTNDGKGISGAAWHVSIVPIRVLGRCGGRTDDIASAIRWAAGISIHGVKDNPHGAVDVINLSLGSSLPCSQVQGTIQSAINDALQAGVLTVAAAGNEKMDVSGVFPAGCDNVITVSASDWRGYFVERYSNFGKNVVNVRREGDGSCFSG